MNTASLAVELPATITRADATSQGSRYYFTGLPCRRGHTAERYAGNGRCVACRRADVKADRADPVARDAARAYWRRYNAKRLRTNPEHRDYMKRYLAAYAVSGKLAEALRRHQGKRKGMEAFAVAWADREAIRAVYGTAAALTRSSGTDYEVDHVVPTGSKLVCGLHVVENLQVIPARQNATKGNRWSEQLSRRVEAEQMEWLHARGLASPYGRFPYLRADRCPAKHLCLDAASNADHTFTCSQHESVLCLQTAAATGSANYA